jgi:CHAD domain-containing protein
MSYRLHSAEPLKDAVPAVAAEQLDAAIARLKSADRGQEAIHDARKHFKRTRALLDLVRPVAGQKALRKGQKRLSSASRTLAASRDAQVAANAAEALENEFGNSRHAQLFSDLTSWLYARRDRIEEKLNRARLEGALQDLEKAKASLLKLDLRSAKMSELLESAAETYRRGRHAMKTALATGKDEDLHNWRKQTQRHWRHMRLLNEAWPKEAKARITLAHRLSDILGTHHDLAVLREMILTNRDAFRGPDDVETLCRCIKKKQASLVSKAATRGERLYAEKPRAFLKRLGAYWHGAEQEHAHAA